MRRLLLTTVVIAIATLAAVSVEEKQKTVAGDWTLTLTAEHFPLRLVLTQKGQTLGGMLDYPHGRPIPLTGTFRAGKITFSGDSGGENFTVHADATGSLAADGTLMGTINAHIVDLDDSQKLTRTHDQQSWRGRRYACRKNSAAGVECPP